MPIMFYLSDMKLFQHVLNPRKMMARTRMAATTTSSTVKVVLIRVEQASKWQSPFSLSPIRSLKRGSDQRPNLCQKSSGSTSVLTISSPMFHQTSGPQTYKTWMPAMILLQLVDLLKRVKLVNNLDK